MKTKILLTLQLALVLCTVWIGAGLRPTTVLAAVPTDYTPVYETVRIFGDPPEDGYGFAMSPPHLSVSPALMSAPVIQGSDGALYGTTGGGGLYDGGTIFKINADGTSTTLHHFSDAGLGHLGVIQGADGALYGTTTYGGSANAGTIFKLDASGYQVLWNFDAADANNGAYPFARLLQGSDGFLYGTTYDGGTFNGGTAFKIGTNGSCYTNLASFDHGCDFNCLDLFGGHPVASLIELPDGKLYGTTTRGNGCALFNDRPLNFGTMFRLDRDGSGLTTLHSFAGPCPDCNARQIRDGGLSSNGALARGDDGVLYGTLIDNDWTEWGLFKINADGSGYAKLREDVNPYAPALMKASDGNLYAPGVAISTDGTVIRLQIPDWWYHLGNFGSSSLVQGMDGALYGTLTASEIFRLKIACIYKLEPASAPAGSASLSLVLSGFFGGSSLDGATVFWNGVPRATTAVSPSKLQATITTADLESTADLATATITVLMPDGRVSNPLLFTITSPHVGVVESVFVVANQSVSVSTPNVTTALDQPGEAAISATVNNTGEADPIVVSAATFVDNPTTSPIVDVGGGYVDLKIVGADEQDSATANFYYPSSVTGATEESLVLKYYNVIAARWDPVISSGPSDPAKETADNQDGTISGGRFTVTFDNTSTPKITELSGTVFSLAGVDTTAPTLTCPANITLGCSVSLLAPVNYAVTATDDIDPNPVVTCSPASGSGFPIGTTSVTCTARDASGNQTSCSFTVTRAALGFSGFHAPIGGADATGGSFANPLRTFKLNSTIPIKFTLACSGAPVLAGVHTLQAIKYSDETTPGTPIDATPTDAATSGNQFQLTGSEWHFNLDTKATGLNAGIWLLHTTLSDGSQHSAWIQIK